MGETHKVDKLPRKCPVPLKSYPEEGVPLAAAWQRGPLRAQEEARILVGLGVGTVECSGQSRTKSQSTEMGRSRWGGVQGRVQTATVERLREGGREADPERPQIPCQRTWTLSSRLCGEH